MLGLLMMLSGLLTVACGVSYWISWDMQHKECRTSFGRKVSNDLLDLLRKYSVPVRNVESQSASISPDRVGPVARRHAPRAPARERSLTMN